LERLTESCIDLDLDMSKFYSSGVPLFLGDSPSPVFTAVVWAGFLPMSCIQSRRTTELYSDQCGAFNLTYLMPVNIPRNHELSFSQGLDLVVR
jgi:hypothetical protein